MSRTTHATFSGNAINVTLPKSWRELTQPDLAIVYHIMAAIDTSELLFTAFRMLSGLSVARFEGEKTLLCFPTDRGNKYVWVTAEQIAELIEPLGFVLEPGDFPVRLDVMNGANAVDPQLHGVSFGDYIRLENLFQGYIQSRNEAALASVAGILYPGCVLKEKPDPVMTLNLVNWMTR